MVSDSLSHTWVDLLILINPGLDARDSNSAKLARSYSLNNGEDFTMNRKLFALVLGGLFCVSAVGRAAVYDNVYWVGGSGEWTGDVTASPEYATGHWSASPTGPGLPAKFVLGRNDGLRTNSVIGNGGYDLDRVPCGGTFACDATHGAGAQ